MFKNKIQLVIFVVLAVFTVYSLWPQGAINEEELTNWNFSLLDKNTVQFMGIAIGRTTLEQSASLIKTTGKYAMFIEKTKPVKRQVEAFYKDVRQQGTLVLSFEAGDDVMQAIEKTAQSPFVYPNGTIKISIENQNIDIIKNLVVNAITFIPYRKIDQKLFVQRFGKPEKVVKLNDQEHSLYPGLGLDITRSEDDSDVLQIVNPDRFDKLLEPLGKS